MREKEINEDPGCCWIQVGSDVMIFVADDRLRTEMDQIHMTLEMLQREMGYLDSKKVLFSFKFRMRKGEKLFFLSSF